MNPRPQAPVGGSPSYTERTWTIDTVPCAEGYRWDVAGDVAPEDLPLRVVEASALVAEREAREKLAKDVLAYLGSGPATREDEAMVERLRRQARASLSAVPAQPLTDFEFGPFLNDD